MGAAAHAIVMRLYRMTAFAAGLNPESRGRLLLLSRVEGLGCDSIAGPLPGRGRSKNMI